MSDRSGLTAVGCLVAVAALGFACSPPVAPQTPPPPADSAAPADSSSAAPPAVDHLEECLTRVLHEGIPSKAGGAAEGDALARAAEAKRVQGDGKSERETYFQLIQESPHSLYVPFAYFRFGELFKAEAQTDSTKAALAEEAYKEALKVPAPGNRLFLLARFRLGQISELENQPANARDAYQAAVDDASANADWDCAVEVAEGAQRALEALNGKTNAEE
jgi:hypothetical protein